MYKRLLITLLGSLALALLFFISLTVEPNLARVAHAQSDRNPGEWYIVQRGDTWYKLAQRYGVSIAELWAANPDHHHYRQWLIIGHRIWIPHPGPGDCPADFADYPAAIQAKLNSGVREDELRTWLTDCGVIGTERGTVLRYALDNIVEEDFFVVIDNAPNDFFGQSRLLVYHLDGGYEVMHEVESEGRIDLLSIGDLNEDGRRELIWTDTFCGAHTCVSELKVEQWDGSSYADWIIGRPTMETATYVLSDTLMAEAGPEILVHGGAIGSVGAGPVRTRTETYAAPPGQPYQQWGEPVYDPSPCYYHNLLDANRAFDLADAPESGGYLWPITLYQDLLSDGSLTTCGYGDNPAELVELQDFSRFRLVVANAAIDEPTAAADWRNQITTPVIQGAADAFLATFSTPADLAAACAAVTTYAEANPASWDYLADWGYGNPPFYAEWLCSGSAMLTGLVWSDYCPVAGMFGAPSPSCIVGTETANGIWEAGEDGIPDVTVQLYATPCAALDDYPVDMQTTDAAGWFTFDLLTAGDYCVVVDAATPENSAILIPGDWTAPPGDGSGVARLDLNLAPGAGSFFTAQLGWDYQFD